VEYTLDEEHGATQAPDPNTCGSCRQPHVERGYRSPLCSTCRTALARRPVPPWITGTGVLIAIMLAVALVKFPASLGAGLAYERGQRAERARDYARAVSEYERVVRRFPDSTEATARLGVAHFRAGHLLEAAVTLDKIGGRESPSKELASEVSQVWEEIEKKIKVEEK
jgi:hypothetical protein